MGLDMYLTRVKREDVAYWRKANAIHKWFEDHCADGEIENCRDYYVSKEQLEELLNTCKHVIASSQLEIGKIKNGERLNNVTNKWEPIYEAGKKVSNPAVAQELLPTETGFFFGSQDYDQYYIEDLKKTVQQIETILAETDFDNESIVYYAWW